MNRIVESFPERISTDIFKAYRSFTIRDQKADNNTGLMIDDGLFEFCFIKEDDIKLESDGNLIDLPRSFGFGRVKRPFKFIIPDEMNYFAIKIQPWVSSFFFTENHETIIDLSKAHFKDIDSLHEDIFSTQNVQEQITFVETYFLRQVLPDMESCRISKEICTYIYEQDGDIKIASLLAKFPHSRQKLNRLFLNQTKNSIKEFARHTRLRAVMSYQSRNPDE